MEDRHKPKLELVGAAMDVRLVNCPCILPDTEVASLDEREPVATHSTGGHANKLVRIKNGKADFSDDSLVVLPGLDVDSHKENTPVWLRRQGDIEIQCRDGRGRLPRGAGDGLAQPKVALHSLDGLSPSLAVGLALLHVLVRLVRLATNALGCHVHDALKHGLRAGAQLLGVIIGVEGREGLGQTLKILDARRPAQEARSRGTSCAELELEFLRNEPVRDAEKGAELIVDDVEKMLELEGRHKEDGVQLGILGVVDVVAV